MGTTLRACRAVSATCKPTYEQGVVEFSAWALAQYLPLDSKVKLDAALVKFATYLFLKAAMAFSWQMARGEQSCRLQPSQKKDLELPPWADSTFSQVWSLTLHASNQRRLPETGAHNESLMLDSQTVFEWSTLWPAFAVGAQPSPLFEVEYREVSKTFSKACLALSYERKGVHHLYQLCHGRDSYDAANQERTEEDIRKRGRWQNYKSIQRYECGGRLAEVMCRLNTEEQAHVRQRLCQQLFPRTLWHSFASLRAQESKSSSSSSRAVAGSLWRGAKRLRRE